MFGQTMMLFWFQAKNSLGRCDINFLRIGKKPSILLIQMAMTGIPLHLMIQTGLSSQVLCRIVTGIKVLVVTI